MAKSTKSKFGLLGPHVGGMKATFSRRRYGRLRDSERVEHCARTRRPAAVFNNVASALCNKPYNYISTNKYNLKYKLLCPRGTQTCALAVANIEVNGNGKVILDTHPESDQHQNWTVLEVQPLLPPTKFGGDPWTRSWDILRTKKCAQTDRQTDRQTHADDHKTLRPTARR